MLERQVRSKNVKRRKSSELRKCEERSKQEARKPSITEGAEEEKSIKNWRQVKWYKRTRLANDTKVVFYRKMLARQVTAVISSSGEPHRAGLRQTHLRHVGPLHMLCNVAKDLFCEILPWKPFLSRNSTRFVFFHSRKICIISAALSALPGQKHNLGYNGFFTFERFFHNAVCLHHNIILFQQHQHQHPSQATRDGGIWRPGNNHGDDDDSTNHCGWKLTLGFQVLQTAGSKVFQTLCFQV